MSIAVSTGMSYATVLRLNRISFNQHTGCVRVGEKCHVEITVGYTFIHSFIKTVLK